MSPEREGLEQERNELLHEKLSEYFAELCDLWDINFIEITKEGEEMMMEIAAQIGNVTHNYTVQGPSSESDIN
tara:strand:+ start:506 stop:724 length:219 start_codon:yes stop_codon:yes gene_type:complete